MLVTLSWQDIALRLSLALAASFLIGFNRDEHGKTAGLRTTILVCLAATLAMLQANALMPTTGKAQNSFVVLDLMRLPLGILSGIGFLGAGAILRKGRMIVGLTTAATLWFVTVLGLLFGGGQILLGILGTILGAFILWPLKMLEKHMPFERRATLCIHLAGDAPTEEQLRHELEGNGHRITRITSRYRAGKQLRMLECDVRWMTLAGHPHETPGMIRHISALPGVRQVEWRS